jgi:signal transduction histidine kinase
MKLLRGKCGALVVFLGIAMLVAGGLAWVTREALQMEHERRQAAAARDRENLQKERDERWAETVRQIEADWAEKRRLALWRLDGRLTPALAREDSRPYPHYEALHTPFPALNSDGAPWEPGQVLIPSPLLTAKLPEWMLLHFQVDPNKGWTSPQVIPESLQRKLRSQPVELAIDNVDDEHKKLLNELRSEYPPSKFFTCALSNGIEIDNIKVQQQVVQPEPPGQPGPAGNSVGNLNPQYAQNSANPVAQNPNFDRLNSPFESGGRQGVINRAKNEGLWAYLNDGRNYSSMQGIFPFKMLDVKQADVRVVERQLAAATDEAKKKELQARLDNLKKEVEDLRRALQPVEVELASLQPIWLPGPENPKHLLMVRPARVGNQPAYQGILLDWPKIKEILKEEIDYLLPNARLVPLARTDPNRLDKEMFVLPVELDPGPLELPAKPEPIKPPEVGAAGWTPLRIGLALAWAAALVALVAVGLGGWTLLDLSERRIRFVSAVTHELRTPLTTLRLYLDLLNSGMVSDEKQREEYIKTLGGEADRLHRLIGNVLDFARLEKARPTVDKRPVPIAALLEQVRAVWNERCAASGKDLQIECALPAEAMVTTDRNLVEQIVGNLIDNARKYSQDAPDPHIWLRARLDGGKLMIEVEDRGPGVTKRERSSIFRPFRRGSDADVKAGGVGLGLALATRWAAFIGGSLSVRAGEGGIGACFRLELPA